MGYPKLPSKAGFGETLRAMRKERKLTLGDLADRAGLTVVAVSDLERGRQKDITTVPLYLHALGLDSRAKLILGAAAESAWRPWHQHKCAACGNTSCDSNDCAIELDERERRMANPQRGWK